MLNGQLLSIYFVKPVIMSQGYCKFDENCPTASASPSKDPLICNVYKVKTLFCASLSYDWLTMYGTCYFFSTKERGELANSNTSCVRILHPKNTSHVFSPIATLVPCINYLYDLASL